jgi:hypothetical protein
VETRRPTTRVGADLTRALCRVRPCGRSPPCGRGVCARGQSFHVARGGLHIAHAKYTNFRTDPKLTSTYNSTEFGVPNPSESKQPPKYAWLGATGAASEITFSGTITDGGGSYIPQIARSLETFQVTPPGAYPNGSGPGAPYTTGLSAEQISLGNDLAAGAPAREAERQKALEEEAKRKLAEEDPKCALIIEVGKTESSTHREWVYARGWGFCSNELLPRYTELEVCLIGEDLETIVPVPAYDVGCSYDGSGYDPYTGKEEGSRVTELYAHEHTPCSGGVAYWGWAWFWVPHNSAQHKYSKEPWECGYKPEMTIEEFLYTFLENGEPPQPPDE